MAGSPAGVTISDARLSLKMSSDVFEMGLRPRDAYTRSRERVVDVLGKCHLRHLSRHAVDRNLEMDVRGAALVPAWVNGGECHFAVTVARLNAAKVGLILRGPVLRIVPGGINERPVF